MASPFRVFRKHQRILIATLGLLAMIAFVFLPMMLKSSGRASRKNPVVVTTTKYGDLRLSDLNIMQNRRQRLLRFLEAAVRTAGGDDRVVLMKLNRLRQMFGDVSEQTVVNLWLLVRRADELGIVVTDRTISEFLRDLTADRLTNGQFAQLHRQLRMPEEEVFNSLHDELLATNVLIMFDVSLRPTTPAQRWDYYQRLHRKVDLEVAPVEVARFVDQVPNPGDRVLEEFFEKYKDQYTLAGWPEPGFRVPKKVAIEYVKAEYEKFADPAAVTDKEIKDYYMENRETYRNIVLPGEDFDEPAPTGEAKPEGQPEAAKDQSTSPPAENVPTEEKRTKTSEAPEKKPAKNDAPGSQPDTQPKSGSSGSTIRSPFHFVAMEGESKESTDKPKSDPPKRAATKEVEAKSKDQPALELPELPEDVPEPPKAESPKPDEKQPTSEKEAAPADATPKPEYKPLEEVKEEIRTTLARQKAKERIEHALAGIQSKMMRHRDVLIKHRVSEKNQDKPAPTLDLAPLAKAANLSFHKREWFTPSELRDRGIGQSSLEGHQPFVREVFGSMPQLQPSKSWDLDQNGYLSWKVDEAEERVPTFDEKAVRKKVLDAWVFVEARKLAKQHAEKLARQARKTGDSLRDSIGKQPDVDVSKTGLFSWLTTGTLLVSQDQKLRISSVEDVEMAGNDFMRTAYGLTVGEVGVAINRPQTIVYVIRLIKTTPLNAVLMASFEADDYGKYMAVGGVDAQKVIGAWHEGLQRDAGLKWQRPPKRPQAR